MTRINIGRALIVTGFLIGLTSLSATYSHINDPSYLLSATYDNGPGHAHYHGLQVQAAFSGLFIA
jgi:hypothetical protein